MPPKAAVVVRRLPDSRYFELFGLTPALNLDLKDLEQRYFRLSRQWHPDLFARKSAVEQQTALDQTATQCWYRARTFIDRRQNQIRADALV